MRKAVLAPWLVAASLIFSALLNVAHGYEHDDHEQHSEECEICILLSSLTDLVVNNSNSNTDQSLAETQYFFIAKNNLSSAIRFAHPRAPPRKQIII